MAFIQNTLIPRWKTIHASWRFAIITFLVVRLFYAVWSWAILTAQPLAVQNIELYGEPIVTIFSLHTSQAYTYRREVNGAVQDFAPTNAYTITDLETGSIWDITTGTAIEGLYKGNVLAPAARAKASGIFPYHSTKPFPGAWLAIWQRFDANWYTSIAETGYGLAEGDDHFPPLLPVLIRILKPLFGSAFLAGLFICHLATLFVIKLLYDTFGEWGGNAAGAATLFFMVYPTSFFLFSVYSESIFLVAALLAFQQMRKQSWAWAGFWIFCAILTRLQGAALILPLLYLMWHDRPFLRKFVHWFGLILSALGGFFYLFMRSRQGTTATIPFLENEWHARLVPPWETYGYAIRTLFSGNATFNDALNWIIATLFIILLIVGWRKIPLEYHLYTAACLFIILIRIVETQPLISMSRYSLTLFPTFFVLALAGGRPWLRRLILYMFIPLNLYLSAQFFLWGWVA